MSNCSFKRDKNRLVAAVESCRLRNASLSVGQLSSQDLGSTASHHIPPSSTMEPRRSMRGGRATKDCCYGPPVFLVGLQAAAITCREAV